MTNGFTEVIAHYLFSFEGTKPSKSKSGDYSGEVTPVPISNTVVKLLSADDTWWEAAWESRTLPVFYLPKYFYYIENIAEQYSYITTKVPCEAVLMYLCTLRSSVLARLVSCKISCAVSCLWISPRNFSYFVP